MIMKYHRFPAEPFPSRAAHSPEARAKIRFGRISCTVHHTTAFCRCQDRDLPRSPDFLFHPSLPREVDRRPDLPKSGIIMRFTEITEILSEKFQKPLDKGSGWWYTIQAARETPWDQRAGVVELADTRDLKSREAKASYRFEPGVRHFPSEQNIAG